MRKQVKIYLKIKDYFKELELRRIQSMEKVKKDKMVNLMDKVKAENE